MKRTVTLVSKEQAEVGHRFRVVNIPLKNGKEKRLK